MRRLIVLAVFAATLLLASPVSAASGLHVAPTVDADAAGCHGLDVWNGSQKLKTIPADDGFGPSPSCGYNSWSGVLPNGNLVFDWNGSSGANLFGSDGTRVGTQGLGGAGSDPRCSGRISFQIVGQAAYWWYDCEMSVRLHATMGTNHTTFLLPGENPGFHQASVFVRTGPRIVYYAADGQFGYELSRE